MKFNILETKEYFPLVPMYIEAGLEVNIEDPEPEGIISCLKMMSDDNMIGCATLTDVNGEYIIRCVAIKKEYQGKGLGSILVNKVIEKAKERKAKRVLLTAKVPEFYKKLGFEIISRKEAPFESDCINCHRFHNGCESEVMKLDLNY